MSQPDGILADRVIRRVKMPRLFIGLEVPLEIAQRLSKLRGGLFGARWADPRDYHITLRFIGDVDRRRAREIEDALSEIARDPLELSLAHLDVFGGDKPHTLFASISPSPLLNALQADCERALRRLGLPPESRKFSPHITLARLRSASTLDLADYLAAQASLAAAPFTVERFALFSARDQVGGGPYIVEAAYPLEDDGFSFDSCRDGDIGWMRGEALGKDEYR
jgi:RNA 2',3'-cyclic 3'-phosphodiesterase